MNTLIRIFFLSIICVAGFAQEKTGDTVVIQVGKESRVTFAIRNKEDLETLKRYNFQAVVDDMVSKLEKRDTTPNTKSNKDYLKDSVQQPASSESFDEWKDRRWDSGTTYESTRRTRNHRHHTYHSFNIDLGMNNYLEQGTFPDYSNSLYTVKPWGSWYVALNSTLRSRIAKKFFVEWGGGVSWYNFKFNNYSTLVTKDEYGVLFTEDPRAGTVDFTKSKLTVAYVNAFAVPMIDFGDTGRKQMIFDGERFDRHGGFRFGAGPYIGYRIDSYTKQVWNENGDKQKSHYHDNFYLNNIRYGIRAQIGFRGTDLFFNYDLNELFSDGKGPRLNAFSFGITL